MVLCFCGISCYFSFVTSYFVYLGPPSFFLDKSGYKFVNFIYLFIKPSLGFIVSQAGECINYHWTIRADLTVLLLHFGYCTLLWASEALFLSWLTLLWASEALFLSWLIFHSVKFVQMVRDSFLFHNSLPRVQILSQFLFYFFLHPTQLCGGFSCSFVCMGSSASVQNVHC